MLTLAFHHCWYCNLPRNNTMRLLQKENKMLKQFTSQELQIWALLLAVSRTVSLWKETRPFRPSTLPRIFPCSLPKVVSTTGQSLLIFIQYGATLKSRMHQLGLTLIHGFLILYLLHRWTYQIEINWICKFRNDILDFRDDNYSNSPFICSNFASKVLLILELMLSLADAYDPTRLMKFLFLYFPSLSFAIYFPAPVAHFLLY